MEIERGGGGGGMEIRVRTFLKFTDEEYGLDWIWSVCLSAPLGCGVAIVQNSGNRFRVHGRPDRGAEKGKIKKQAGGERDEKGEERAREGAGLGFNF